MKNKSLSFRINLWYTLLIAALSLALIVFINISGINTQRSQAQQRLIRSVERNIDEIEVENGVLDIESDFAFQSDSTKIVVFSAAGDIIGGSYPDGIEITEPLESGRFQTTTVGSQKYFIYDSIIEFNKYEYKINGLTGEVFSSESEGIEGVTPFDGNLDYTAKGYNLTYRDAWEKALEASGFTEENTVLLMAKPSEYNDIPLYEIEFYSNEKAYSDIWVRGVINANSEDGIWNEITAVALLLLPLLVIFASFIGGKIAKKSLLPIAKLNETVSKIQSGTDLSRRISPTDSDPQIKKLAENFNKMFSRLQKSFEAEKQFTADVSHELRTPVAVIMAECEYQLSQPSLGDEEREGFETVNKQAVSMQSLISQLLNFTRIEQGLEGIEMENADFSELIAELCENMAPIAQQKGIEITTDIDSEILMDMDISLMSRLCENLISNAIHYGKQGGHIFVSLKRKSDGILLSVADDGIGIEKENLEKIWQRFFRIDKSRSREKGCSGLGLAMVKQIAELHSGTVKVESEIGKGSTFTVRF